MAITYAAIMSEPTDAVSCQVCHGFGEVEFWTIKRVSETVADYTRTVSPARRARSETGLK